MRACDIYFLQMLVNKFDIDIALENQKLFHLKLKPNS